MNRLAANGSPLTGSHGRRGAQPFICVAAGTRPTSWRACSPSCATTTSRSGTQHSHSYRLPIHTRLGSIADVVCLTARRKSELTTVLGSAGAHVVAAAAAARALMPTFVFRRVHVPRTAGACAKRYWTPSWQSSPRPTTTWSVCGESAPRRAPAPRPAA